MNFGTIKVFAEVYKMNETGHPNLIKKWPKNWKQTGENTNPWFPGLPVYIKVSPKKITPKFRCGVEPITLSLVYKHVVPRPSLNRDDVGSKSWMATSEGRLFAASFSAEFGLIRSHIANAPWNVEHYRMLHHQYL